MDIQKKNQGGTHEKNLDVDSDAGFYSDYLSTDGPGFYFCDHILSESWFWHGGMEDESKEQVIEMLGKGNNTLDSDDWLYDIGFVPGLFNIDPSNLQIKFKDGVVVSVKQFET